MSKIPVGQVIGETYRFAFTRYFSILGILWLPLLLVAALAFFVVWPLVGPMIDLVQHVIEHPEDRDHTLPFVVFGQLWRIFLFDVLVILIFVMIRVGIVKEALGLRTGPRFVYLSFGMTELRVIGAYVLAFVLFYAAILITTLVSTLVLVAVGFASAGAGVNFDIKSVAGPLAVLVPLCIFAIELFFFYAVIRLTYFIVPVAVVEKRIGLGRSWELSKGNFWRIVGVILAVLLPLIVVEGVFMVTVVLPVVSSMMTQGDGNHAEQFAALLKQWVTYLPYWSAVGFVLAPIVYGLLIAPSAFAYRALVPNKSSEDAEPA